METISIHISDRVRNLVVQAARRAGVSVDAFIESAAAEKAVMTLDTEYLQRRAARADETDIDAILAKVPDVEPEDDDRLPDDVRERFDEMARRRNDRRHQ